jgi:hypothetical protein
LTTNSSRLGKQLLKYFILFTIGGIIYIFIEIVYRGYTHPLMFVLGGLSLIFVGLLDEYKKPPAIKQMCVK